jgi:hypothetical protein
LGLDSNAGAHQNQVFQGLLFADASLGLAHGPLSASATRYQDTLVIVDAQAGYVLDFWPVQISLWQILPAQKDQKQGDDRTQKKKNVDLFAGQEGSKSLPWC